MSHHPQASAHTKARKHHKRTRAVAQTPNPSHPRANTPTASLSKYAPKRTQGTCPHQHVWTQPSVSAGTRVLAEATGTNEAQTTNAGTQDNAHNKRANNQVCVRCAPAPAREDSAREGPLTIAHARARGLLCLWACLRTFVGVFGLVGLGVWVFFGGVWRVFWFFDIFGL